MVDENPLNVLPDAAGVLLHHIRGQPLALARFPARVPDLRRGPSEQRDDVVPGAPEVQQADNGEQVAHMEAVGRGVEAAVYSLRSGLEQPGKLVLCRVFWERILQNTALVQREEQSAGRSGGAVNFRPRCEEETRSSQEATGRVWRNTTAEPEHGHRHVGQCDEEEEERQII